MKFTFNKTYFIYFIALFIIEAAIAVFLSAGFIRSTFGDFLVVILIYCFIKSMFKTNTLYTALGVLAFAFTIEFLQLFNLLKFLYLQNSKLATTVLGSTFQISDLVSYTLGVLTILIVEYKVWKKIL